MSSDLSYFPRTADDQAGAQPPPEPDPDHPQYRRSIRRSAGAVEHPAPPRSHRATLASATTRAGDRAGPRSPNWSRRSSAAVPTDLIARASCGRWLARQPAGQRFSRMHGELCIDVPQVVLHRLRAEEQRRRGLPGASPARQHARDLHLLRGQIRVHARPPPLRTLPGRPHFDGRPSRRSGAAPSRSKISKASRSGSRASTRRRPRRSRDPLASYVFARSNSSRSSRAMRAPRRSRSSLSSSGPVIATQRRPWPSPTAVPWPPHVPGTRRVRRASSSRPSRSRISTRSGSGDRSTSRIPSRAQNAAMLSKCASALRSTPAQLEVTEPEEAQAQNRWIWCVSHSSADLRQVRHAFRRRDPAGPPTSRARPVMHASSVLCPVSRASRIDS